MLDKKMFFLKSEKKDLIFECFMSKNFFFFLSFFFYQCNLRQMRLRVQLTIFFFLGVQLLSKLEVSGKYLCSVFFGI